MSTRPLATDWATDFDHLDRRWVENPYPIWDELRRRCPIAHTERFRGVYFPNRYEDIRAIAYDTEHFSSRRVVVLDGPPLYIPAPPITSDPPEHKPAKTLLLPAFTPEAVQRYEPHTREICRELIDRFAGKEGCDAAVDYAQDIPVRVIAHMLGVPEQDGAQLRTWIHEMLELGITDNAVFMRAVNAIDGYFGTHIAERREAPRDDLISYLIEARIDGRPLDDAHIYGTLRLLMIAGIDTTWSAIGASLWHLATHPEDRDRLVAEPELMPTAVEELLRVYAPVTMARLIVEETEVGGCTFKAGQMVMLPFPAANRDPEVFPDPDKVILDRVENRHMAFGVGIHRCLGAGFARLMIRVSLEEWLRAIPEFDLVDPDDVHWSIGMIWGPRRVAVRVGAG